MTEPNKRVVQRRSDGDWDVRKPRADRASAVTSTQVEGIQRARTILGNDGGGRVAGPFAQGDDPRARHDRTWERPRSSKG